MVKYKSAAGVLASFIRLERLAASHPIRLGNAYYLIAPRLACPARLKTATNRSPPYYGSATIGLSINLWKPRGSQFSIDISNP
jgi:hypothetical protein